MIDAEVVIALVFNGRTAGRIALARDAEFNDGLLDGIFVTRRKALSLLCDLIKFLCGGKPSSVVHIRSRNFRITSPQLDIITDIDGQGGPRFPIDVECLRHAIKLRG